MGCTGSKTGVAYEDINIDDVVCYRFWVFFFFFFPKLFFLQSPTDSEKALVEGVVPLLARTGDILNRLRQYKGCAEYIKVAVRTPSIENDVAAWNAVVPAVMMLKEFFDFYNEFKVGLLSLIQHVCVDDPFLSLPEHLMTAKLIVNMFDFIIKFDEIKMGKASIQNDFSFYRRSVNRMRRGESVGDYTVEAAPVNDEQANRMSLFFAYPNPFTKALIDEFAKEDNGLGPREHLTRCFAVVANACKTMAERGNDKEVNFGLFRAMVAAMLFYDYTSPLGVFVKKSDVDVVGCVTALKRYEGDAMDLLNTIRYGTHTFNSETTPKRIVEIMS